MSPPLVPPPPPPLSERAAKWLFIIACLAWAVLQTHGLTPDTTQIDTPSASTSLAPEFVNIEAQSLSRIDLAFDPKRPIGRDNPWVARQQRPPCPPEIAVEIFELCWFPHGGPLGPSRTRCPPGTMTYNGNCYFPMTVSRNGIADPLPRHDAGELR